MTLHWYSGKEVTGSRKAQFLGFATQGIFLGGINFIFFKSGVETEHMTQRQCSWLDFFSNLHFGSLKYSGCSANGHSHKRTALTLIRPLSQNTIVLSSHTNSAFLHSQKQPALVKDTFFT